MRVNKLSRIALACTLACAMAANAAARQSSKTQVSPVVAQESSLARKVETAMTAAQAGAGGTGWQLTAPLQVSGSAAAVTVRANDVSYLLGQGLALDFEGLEAQVVPQADGAMAVALNLGGSITLRAPEGVWATLNPGRHRIAGLWDPAGESFRSLDVSLGASTLSLANGAMVAVEQISGRFAAQDGRADGNVTVTGVQTGLVGSYQGRTADEVTLGFRLDNPDTKPQMALDYRHSLPRSGLSGIAGELMPLRLTMAARIDPLPWQGVLAELAPWLVEVSRRAPPDPGQMWSALWSHVATALGQANAQMKVERLDARSAGLAANASGSVNFGAAGPRGTMVADLKGINDRIASLSPSDRKQSPMLFPSLALMTVVGDGINEGGTRFHRYRIDLVETGLKVNGRDAGGLKP